MIILGIETTCDETAAAVVERNAEGQGRILSNVVFSQINEHAAFGGVVPEIAARAHVDVLDSIIAKAMNEAQLPFTALDGIAAAAGPGLIGGVIVGLTMAKSIAFVHNKPLIAVNHLEAHALTARLSDATAFPYCLFLASGGHTQILGVRGVGDYLRIGGTVDDAIGEAFDKTAKLLGLGYPGGPLVEKEAARGDPERFPLPRPMTGRHDANFSLSGLKTALRLEAEKIAPLSDDDVADRFTRELAAVFPETHGIVKEVIVQRWEQGIPYSSPGRSVHQATLEQPLDRIFLAGDYLGERGGMDTAATSGVEAATAADALLDRRSEGRSNGTARWASLPRRTN